MYRKMQASGFIKISPFVRILVTKLCPTLCDHMDYSTPGFPVFHYLLEFAQTHVHWVNAATQSPLSSVVPFSSCPQSFPASGSFPMSRLFASGGQSIGVSLSASILPMSIQSWFLLGLSGFLSLLSKGLSRVFPSTAIWKHQFFDTQLYIVQLRTCLLFCFPSSWIPLDAQLDMVTLADGFNILCVLTRQIPPHSPTLVDCTSPGLLLELASLLHGFFFL